MAQTTEETIETTAPKKGPVKRALPFVFVAILIAGAIYGWSIIQFNRVHVNSDDAQIDAEISPIIPRVSGYVASVSVKENDNVDSNAVLVKLDTRDLEIKVQSAEAAIENAQAAVRSAQAAATASKANLATAEVMRKKTANDLARAEGLMRGNAGTQEQVDAMKAAAESAEAQLHTVTDQAAAAQSQVAVAESIVKQRMSDLDNAKLQLSYATITAPMSGIIAKKNVQVGEFIQAGQPLMAIAEKGIWITANFKETQMEKMQVGQKVEFTADAFPDAVFRGTVQSVSPATGAKFSLLPPDNSTGNFVKVTQRVPVRIQVDEASLGKAVLRPGMSVDVTVSTPK